MYFLDLLINVSSTKYVSGTVKERFRYGRFPSGPRALQNKAFGGGNFDATASILCSTEILHLY
jgi:hypothetical protein